MKIKTNYVPDNAKTYLTVGKEYELNDADEDSGWMTDDDGDSIFIMVNSCHHLDNRAWEICDAAD